MASVARPAPMSALTSELLSDPSPDPLLERVALRFWLARV
jgi:hypothetical protein